MSDSRLEPIQPEQLTAGEYLLRPPHPRDAEEILALLTDPDVALWNPPEDIVCDQSSARRWCLRNGDWNEGIRATYAVLETGSGRVVGTVTVHRMDRRLCSAEIGYRVVKYARGQGAATAAVRAVTRWAFSELGLIRIGLHHALGNPASCRVALRAGYQLEGTLRSSDRYGDGHLHDEHLHSRLATDP